MNWLALAVAGLVASAASAETWREYKTAHFILDTDASGAQAESMVSALEKARAADLAVLVGGDVELPGHIRIIAPASRGLFLEMAGDWTAALYMHGPYQEPVVLAPVAGFADDPEVAAHELAHAISRYLFPEQRHWFSEGLAEFVQTVAARRTETGSTASTHIAHGVSMGSAAGAVPTGYAGWLGQSDLAVRSAELLNWNGVEDKALWGRYHAASWLLYHYLWNKRGKALAGLQKQLSTA
jgi:hypothetical protein